ncbi:MAG TPA: hypothetical protein ENN33_00295 [Ignavibacteria bacterium]|nr:hypothetical protein [Ignavibacteria bacterium]
MQRLHILLFILVTTFFITSCSSSGDAVIVAEYGQDHITYDELKEAYVKSLSEEEKNKAESPEEMKEFLDLYVNYKMKLRDAFVRGFTNDPEIQKEIDDYTKTVGYHIFRKNLLLTPVLRICMKNEKLKKESAIFF